MDNWTLCIYLFLLLAANEFVKSHFANNCAEANHPALQVLAKLTECVENLDLKVRLLHVLNLLCASLAKKLKLEA